MNTAKQVNVIMGLLMVGAFATLLYFIWDNTERQPSAMARQVQANAERGGTLFSLNCASCHGLTGRGLLERGGLPGLPLNDEGNRTTDRDAVRKNILKFRETIRCGRVGTLMPAWSNKVGGTLNDFQILQLVALITGVMPPEDVLPEQVVTAADIPADPNAISLAGWQHAVDEINHAQDFDPPKYVTQALDKAGTTLMLDEPYGLVSDQEIRLGGERLDDSYELLRIVDAPASTALDQKTAVDDRQIVVKEAAVFKPGDQIIVESEKMTVKEAPARTVLSADIKASDETITVADSEGFAANEVVIIGPEQMRVISVTGSSLRVERGAEKTAAVDHTAKSQVTEAGDTLVVERAMEGTQAGAHDSGQPVREVATEIKIERGVNGTDAAAHTAGAEAFQPPTLPGTTINESSCGQTAKSTPQATVETVEVAGTIQMTQGDDFFNLGGKQNPTLAVKAGTSVTVNLMNGGQSTHDLNIAGPDGKFDTADDIISDPAAISGAGSGTLTFTFTKAGTYAYRCDFHPAIMKGEITVAD